MSVISSSKIEKKVTALLSHLSRFSFGQIDAKPGVVAVYAKAPVANKLVSVVEIAKRDGARRGDKIFQYSVLGSVLVPLRTKKGGDGDVMDVAGEDNETLHIQDSDEQDAAFETMPPVSQRLLHNPRGKVRSMPVLIVYLSKGPVPELAAEYG